jgi:hypothetical protein
MVQRGVGLGIFALAASLSVASARADTLSLLVENDSFFSASDRDYTNGIELDWSAPHEKDWAERLAMHLPMFANVGKITVQYGLGQLIFTPAFYHTSVPPPNEHPYAGWLYGKFGITQTNGYEQNSLAAEFGLTGPPALGEETQKFIHAIENLPKPLGWDSQLHTEPTLAIFYERSLRIASFRRVFDITPHYGAAAGTLYDYLNAGASVRLGFNMPDEFIPSHIEPAIPGTNEFAHSFGAYLFAGIDGRAVARNLFLDGNTFVASAHVSKKPLVGVFQVGGVIVLGNMRVSFTHVYNTKEFRDQAQTDQFSSINLSMRW